MICNLAFYRITNGTDTINLLGSGIGFISTISTGPMPMKDGGVYANSPLAHGKRLVHYRWDNVVDTISLSVKETDIDSTIRRMEELQKLLIQAVDYWTSPSVTQPVWIEARAFNETFTRYAMIYNYTMATGMESFGQLAMQGAATAIDMAIERANWQSASPLSEGTQLTMSDNMTYRALSYGLGSASTVYVNELRLPANITHVYRDDGGVFSSNLVGTSLPWTLFPAVPVVNDALYIGISDADTSFSGFSNLVFNIGTPMSSTGSYAVTWERYTAASGGSWQAWNVQDSTGSFSVAGTNVVAGAIVNEFSGGNTPTEAVAVNGVTGYWVRCRITARTGTITPPTQTTRRIFTAHNGKLSIGASTDSGALGRSIRLSMKNKATSATSLGNISRVHIGSRSVSRGSNFVSCINFSPTGYHNPTGITVTNESGGAPTESNLNPTDYYVVGAGTSEQLQAIVTIDNTLAGEYIGKYRAFVIVYGVSGAGIYRLTTTVGSGGAEVSSNKLVVYGLGYIDNLDFGIVNIPPSRDNPSGAPDQIQFKLYCKHNSSYVFGAMSLHLIPVDEMYIYASTPVVAGAAVSSLWANDDVLTVGSGQFGSGSVFATLDNSSGVRKSNWTATSTGPARLPAGAQEIFIMPTREIATYPTNLQATYTTLECSIKSISQYISGVGAG